MRFQVVLGVLVGVAVAAPLAAVGGTIQDQAVSFTYPAVHWGSTAAADMAGAWSAGASDPLRGSGWWYRVVGSDTREYPLPAPDTENYAAGHTLTLTWANVHGKGFSVREDTAVFDGERPSGAFTSQLQVENVSASVLEIEVFHYLDVDVPGNSDDDKVSSLTPAYLRFSDLGGSVIRYRSGYSSGTGVSNAARHFQVGAYPGLRDALNDAAVTDLSDSGAPFGPGNATAAYQWRFTMQPGSQARAQVSVTFREPTNYVKAGRHSGYETGFPNLFFQRISAPELLSWSMRRTAFGGISTSKVLEPNRRIVGTDDFDGDFVTDLVEFDSSSGVTYIHGDPVTGVLPAPLGWRIAATGDFDDDGRPDIVWRSFLTQKIVIWRMNDTTKLGEIVPVPDQAADANWSIQAALDFNGDGRRDLLWYNSTSGNAVIWYMDAQVKRISGAFTTPMSAGNSNWKIVGAGDYGKGPVVEGAPAPVYGAPDIVWRNSTSGKLVVWHMNFAGQRTAGLFTSPDSPSSALDYEVVGPR
jgi:hypothetical protein